MRKPRVLIADDESSVAMSFLRQFRVMGWEVVVSTDAAAIPELAIELRPDLVLLDVDQGDVSGLDVLRALKASPATRGVAVTMISGAPTPELCAEADEAGAMSFLHKPLGRDALLALRERVEGAPAPTVLISDDDELVRHALERNARSEGLNPVSERDASRVVELAERIVPDVIVLDVNQPALDGREVLARLKANPKTSGIRVVVLSGVEAQATRHDCLRLGADDYVVKPLDPLFFPRLARAIGRSGDERH